MSQVVSMTNLQGDLSLIDRMIGQIKDTQDKQVENIQRCASVIVLHAVKHGDVSRATHLVDALGKGVRRDSLIHWFTMEGCMSIIKDDKGSRFGINPIRRQRLTKMMADDGIPALLGYLVKNKPWYESKKEKDPYEGVDLTKALRALIKKAEKAASNPESASKSDLSLLPLLKGIVPITTKEFRTDF